MVADRRVSAGEVTRYVSEMQQEIDRLQQRLESLRQASAGAGAQQRRGRRAAAAPRGRRSGSVTPEQRASRQLQGRYLGLLRQIPASRRGPFQKIARERSREAAIKELTSALGK